MSILLSLVQFNVVLTDDIAVVWGNVECAQQGAATTSKRGLTSLPFLTAAVRSSHKLPDCGEDRQCLENPQRCT